MKNNFGYVKIAAAVPEVKVADCKFNTDKILELIQKAEEEGVEIICFPELCITSYTAADLFFQKRLLDDANRELIRIIKASKTLNITSIIGMPIEQNGSLYNSAVVISSGKIDGIVPKTFLPNNHEFAEKRWFSPAKRLSKDATTNISNEKNIPISNKLIFSKNGVKFGIEICEDIWVPIAPSSYLAINGAEILFNLSASNEVAGKNRYRRSMISQQSARSVCGYIYTSSGVGESSTDLVFSGSAFVAETGTIIAESERFLLNSQLIISEIDVEKIRSERLQNVNFYEESNNSNFIYKEIENNHTANTQKPFTLSREIEKHPFIPAENEKDEICNEVIEIQIAGLAKRWLHTNAKKLIIGVSGGLDSTLALLICAKTADKLKIDRKQVLGITMPSFGTTDRTYQNAIKLMEKLGVETREINIQNAVLQHFKDINHNANIHDVTYENAQARERTQILMDIANKEEAIVIGTGDLSEIALGWNTYNGDHISMYAVNSGIPKTFIKVVVDILSRRFSSECQDIVTDILDTPISPELLPANNSGEIAQKTEEIVGPYELHDFFLYNMVKYGFAPDKILFLATKAFDNQYSREEILKWLKIFIKRFFSQQFKRSCSPDGVKIGSVNLSPRGEWKMASDAIAFNMENI